MMKESAMDMALSFAGMVGIVGAMVGYIAGVFDGFAADMVEAVKGYFTTVFEEAYDY